MGKIQDAVSWAENIANDNSHGYGWGGWGPEYDCGHLIIMAWENAGIPVRAYGASYTGNMPEAFMACGFRNVINEVNKSNGAGAQLGDVLVNRENHAAMVVSGGRIVQARSDLDGMPGDSSGQEIRTQGWYDYPWTHILRYAGSDSQSQPETPAEPETSRNTLKKGMRGEDVKTLQQKLLDVGYSVGNSGTDGIYGNDTLKAVAAFQEEHGIPVTGVADPETIRALNDAPPKEQVFSLPEMQSGSRGDAAVFLQAALNLLNYNCGTGDGIFGAKTAAALNRFKEARQLPTDGKVDAALWEELLNVLLKGVRK